MHLLIMHAIQIIKPIYKSEFRASMIYKNII